MRNKSIMNFDEITELFEVFKKLHTANQGIDKTIFYKDVSNMNGVMSITNFDGSVDNFKLSLISHMSLSKWDGLLIQYDSLDGRKMYPYKYDIIKDINIDLK